MMVELPLSKEIILDTAEQVLRRYGIDKTTVVDVARSLNVSHATIYRYFPSKASMREAVAERWLHKVADPLAAIHIQSGSAIERMRLWFDTLIGIKRAKAEEDPELFAVYSALADEAVEIVNIHINDLILQLAKIVDDGINGGEFKSGASEAIATAAFMATVRFHHPKHAKEWTSPTIDHEFEMVWNLILFGLLQNRK